MKLRIKSFRVPELFVDIPETATVGSLKVTTLHSSSISLILTFYVLMVFSLFEILMDLLLLQRMVMEAVSTLLSDGHRVGLMVQGKKVRDDNKTLYQTGISQDNNHLDSLDFSLEPSSEAPQLLTRFIHTSIHNSNLALRIKPYHCDLSSYFLFQLPAGACL